jgi:hypothetical protein
LLLRSELSFFVAASGGATVPIIYIHGVNTRTRSGVEGLEHPFRRWIADVLNPDDPDSVDFIPVFWGDRAADFRWKLASRPRSALLAAGAGQARVGLVRAAPRALMAARSEPESAPAGPVIGAGPVISGSPTLRLDSVPREARADLLSDLYAATRLAAAEDGVPLGGTANRSLLDDMLAPLAAVAAEVADEMWDSASGSDQAKLTAMLSEIDVRLAGVVGGGAPGWFARAGELARRALLLPGDVVSTVLAEARPALNGFVANFLGDVLTYVNERGRDSAPGPIPLAVMEGMRRARRARPGEPVVVVTHSMGGQLFYDYLVNFAAHDPELADFEIDHWISCGSQVSFFAELCQFLDQDRAIRAPAKLPLPPRVRRWTNFYDPNDFVGFVMSPVFDQATDREYDTGAGLILAHVSYLQRPSFFAAMRRALADG